MAVVRSHVQPQGERRLIAGPQDIPLYVETYGDPVTAKYTLICIHGALQSLHCWRQQFPFFSEHETYLIAMDLPWHGASGPVPQDVKATPELWADSLNTVLCELRFSDQPVFLMFWSFGGLVVRHYINRYGLDGISGLISVASILAGMQGWEQFGEENETTALTARLLSPNLPFELRASALDQFVTRLTHRQPSLPDYYYTYGYNAKALLSLNSQGPALVDDTPDDPARFLHSIEIPTLAIQGDADTLVSPILALQTVEWLPHGRLRTYERCGHSPHLEQPRQFNRDVLAFLQEILPTS